MSRVHSSSGERRIRVVIGSLDLGGAEWHLLQVLPALAKRGWSPRVLTLSPRRGILESDIEDAGVPVVKMSRGSNTAGVVSRVRQLGSASANLYRELRANQAEITWFLLPEAYLIGATVGVVSRISGAMVMSRRSLNLYQIKYPGSRWLERKFHRRMSLVLANSLAVARELRDVESVPADRLRVIYNGIDCSSIDRAASREATRAALDISTDALVMIVVANLIPYKGHADLLQALSMAADRLPRDWVLLCAGSGDEYRRELERLGSELGLDSRIRWLGKRHDVPDLLRAADLALLPSHEEGFSNALLEAMAAGLPVIATDVGGNREAVCDGLTGIIVPPRAPARLADAITSLAGDRSTRVALGDRGRELVQERFSLSACVASYDRLFSALAEQQSLPSPGDLGLPEIGAEPCAE